MRPALALLLLSVSSAACTLSGDPPTPAKSDPLGNGIRVADVQDPKSPHYHVNQSSTITSAVVVWHDTFDETMDGKSVGTLYIQDVGSNKPYAGIGIYQPNYVPASLTVVPGDVLDFTGPYQESPSIGTAMFNSGTFLPQLYKPVGTYRYEFVPPPPLTVTLSDLIEDSSSKTDGNFAHARQFEGMLVTINNVTLTAGVNANKRVSYLIEDGDGGVPSTGPSVTNELYNLGATDFPPGSHFKSITGIVTWFYSFHIAPRTKDDFVQ